MMIVITKHDIARMSPALRAELLNLMFEQSEQWKPEISSNTGDSDDLYFPYPSEPIDFGLDSEPPDSSVSKTVIEADMSDITRLISNLSEKSIETLKFFASTEPVAVEDLVGDEKPYASYIELKRSFVGPVNRRLRTVTKNRSAVLFRKVSENDDEIMIGVKQGTADAIRCVLLTDATKHEGKDYA